MDKAWNKLTDVVKNALDAAKQQFFDMKNALLSWTQSIRVKPLIELSKCLLSGYKFAKEITETFKGFYFKITELINAAATPLTLIAVAADISLDLICNWKEFDKALAFFKYGLTQTVQSIKYYYIGLGAGSICNAIGTAETIKEAFSD